MRRFTTGIRSEKCVVRRFRRCANVIVQLHKPWNLTMTWPPFGWKSFHASVSRIGRFHPYWSFLWQVIFLQKFLPLSYLLSVVDRNVVMRSMAVFRSAIVFRYSNYVRTGRSGVRIPAGSRDLLFTKTVQTGCGAHWVSYWMRTAVLCRG